MFRTHCNKDSRIWSGNDIKPLFNPKLSVGETVLHYLIANGTRTARVYRNYFCNLF